MPKMEATTSLKSLSSCGSTSNVEFVTQQESNSITNPVHTPKIARRENLKNLRQMDVKAYNGIILKELKLRLNDPLVDKYAKKLTKQSRLFSENELKDHRSIVMGSTRVQTLISILNLNSCALENQIFRKSVGESELSKLDAALRDYDSFQKEKILSQYTNHHLAALLKKYLREFEDSLFPKKFLPLYFLLENVINDDQKFCECLQLLNMLIPLPNKKLLESLLRLLNQVIETPESNMNANSLAVLFLPSIFTIKTSSNAPLKPKKKKEMEIIMTKLDSHTNILSKIIQLGLKGFSNEPRSTKELLILYENIIKTNQSNNSRKSVNKLNKQLLKNALNGSADVHNSLGNKENFG